MSRRNLVRFPAACGLADEPGRDLLNDDDEGYGGWHLEHRHGALVGRVQERLV